MITLSIPSISCGHCARAITAAVHALDPHATVTVDVPTRSAAIDSSASDAALRARLAAEGYPADA